MTHCRLGFKSVVQEITQESLARGGLILATQEIEENG